jgi:hypothetical protein
MERSWRELRAAGFRKSLATFRSKRGPNQPCASEEKEGSMGTPSVAAMRIDIRRETADLREE